MTIKKEYLKELKKIYNVSEIEILNLLLQIINRKFNTGEIFVRNEKLYERYINLLGEFKERRFRLSKKHIESIKEELVNELIKKNLKKLKKEWLHKVCEGKVKEIKNNNYYIDLDIDCIDCKNCIYYLPFQKTNKRYKIGDKAIFHINRISYKDGKILVRLDDYSDKITIHLIKKILSGFYIKKVKIYKDFIKLKVSPELPDHKKELLELTLGKKVYLLKDKDNK